MLTLNSFQFDQCRSRPRGNSRFFDCEVDNYSNLGCRRLPMPIHVESVANATSIRIPTALTATCAATPPESRVSSTWAARESNTPRQ